MMAFRNLSVRGKVLLIVLCGVLFQVVIAAAGLYYLNDANQSLTTTVELEAEAIRQAARVRAVFLDLIISEKNMIMSQVEADRSRYRAEFDANKREPDTRLGELRTTLGTVGRQHLEDFDREYREFLAIHQQVAELSARNEAAEAMRLSTGAAEEHADKARAALVGLMDELDGALHRRELDNSANARTAMALMIAVLLATLLVALGLGLAVTRAITSGLGTMVAVADSIAGGKLDNEIDTSGRNEVAQLALSVNRMQASLRAARGQEEAQSWLKTGLGRINDVMRGDLDIGSLAMKVVSEITSYLDAKIGAFYVMAEQGGEATLSLLGSYAYTKRKNLSNQFKVGEGLVGQAALERQQILIRNVPEDYVKVTSGLGEAIPRFICVTPLVYEGQVKGVLEIGTLDECTDLQLEYLRQVVPVVAITLETAQGREELARALGRAQQLAEELQAQQEELRASNDELQAQQEELRAANEELEEQTQALKVSEEKLRAQQEEMEVVNEELEEKNELLERQKRDVEQARREIADRAEDLALASKYKSEFLANMSHELRTPLNSLLILARIFADNRDGNLSDEQVESARVIYNSGTDLLGLINDILDLAKIEAGRMDLQIGRVSLRSVAAGIVESFQHIAADRGLQFEVQVSPDAPDDIFTDRKRLDQILKNLVSNAIKFTEHGSVGVVMGRPPGDVALPHGLPSRVETVAIAVRDTGIGIEKDKQKVIFEAFQQADGGTARKYGGTGLGLSITRELAHLLGGNIQVVSEPGKGSTFTVVLPLRAEHSGSVLASTGQKPRSDDEARAVMRAPRPPASALERVEDDRDSLCDADTAILIVDDDANFARLLAKQCHDKGFKSLVAPSGEEGLKLAESHLPKGIILDIKLPGMDGWTVLEMLKENPKTRHIPVHIMSVEEPTLDALRKGAIGFLSKPPEKAQVDAALQKVAEAFSKKVKNVLVVEDDDQMRRNVVELIGDADVHVSEAASGTAAIEAMRSRQFDCVVLDLGLPDMDGTQVLRAVASNPGVTIPPVIVHTGRDITHDEELALRDFSESIIIKDVRSDERLMDEVSLFLHRVVSQMPDKKRKMITDLHDVDRLFKGKRILIVDDDMRTVFALSKILTAKGVKTLKAENGQKALSVLEQSPDVDLVLMDIMMPVMDGYETMKKIRAQERFRGLPIIALTAKAMKGDQQLCIASGASDYLAKPLDENRLYSMMRVWLYR
ncbi:MAG: response regulator [Polyangiaceae bacterium]|nr:response regulator [Polyangiaceae bacterium]